VVGVHGLSPARSYRVGAIEREQQVQRAGIAQRRPGRTGKDHKRGHAAELPIEHCALLSLHHRPSALILSRETPVLGRRALYTKCAARPSLSNPPESSISQRRRQNLRTKKQPPSNETLDCRGFKTQLGVSLP